MPPKLKKKKKRIVTHSELSTFKSCPQKHNYAYEIGWKSRITSIATLEGIAGHRALEEHYLGHGQEKAEAAIKGMFRSYLERNPYLEPEQAEKVVQAEARSIAVFRHYLKHYKDNDFTPYHDFFISNSSMVEGEFLIPIYTPSGRQSSLFMLAGKRDLIIKHEGKNWIVDHKFYASISGAEGDRLSMDQQMRAYAYATQVYDAIPIHGACYNIIKRKAPRQPKINKNGTVSKSPCDTTKEIFLKALHDEGQTTEGYEDILERLENNLFFARYFHEYTEQDYKAVQMELYQTTLLLHQCTFRYRNDAACDHWGGCKFRPLCMGLPGDGLFDLKDTKHPELTLANLHPPWGKGYVIHEEDLPRESLTVEGMLDAVNA